MLSANDMESYLESSDSVEWENAIESEIYSLATMSTWSLSYWLDDRRAMKYKWMFMIKTNSDGSVERFKVRLVVNGFSEVPGVDYSTLMHGYPKMVPCPVPIGLAVELQMDLHHLDFTTVFLDTKFHDNEVIFMEVSEGETRNG